MKTRLTTLLPAALCLVLSSCGADGLKTIDIARGLRTDSYSGTAERTLYNIRLH